MSREVERSRGREVSHGQEIPAFPPQQLTSCQEIPAYAGMTAGDAGMRVDLERELRERGLRQKIQAHRIRRLGWSDYVLHYVMEGLGFGTSLRALGEDDLTRLWEIIRSYRKHGRPVEFNYDKQGCYMHAMMKRAGWDENTLRAYLIIHYKKTHWNLLDKAERRDLVDLLKGLGDREESPLTPNPSPARGEGNRADKTKGKEE